MRRYDTIADTGLAFDAMDIIDDVIDGRADWTDLTTAIGEGIPSSFVALMNINTSRPADSYFSSYNMEQWYISSFQEHFARLNPWNATWSTLGSGDIIVSEEIAPARTFANTEFYEDWLRPQGSYDAGVGLQIVSGSQQRIYLSIHYPVDAHESYGHGIHGFCQKIRGHLARATRLAEQVSIAAAGAAAESALLGRFDCCAVVVDGNSVVKDANALALAEFRRGTSFKCVNGKLVISADSAHDIPRQISALARGNDIKPDQSHFTAEQRLWTVRLTAIKINPGGVGLIAPPSRQVLVLANDLRQRDRGGKFEPLENLFGLTPSETRLCQALLAGHTLYQSAEILQISREHGRQKLKSVFSKVGVNRQIDLILLLSRLH
jgi:DNA-binding CsgD family transcriptional regulator